jgi:hypothetical protein
MKRRAYNIGPMSVPGLNQIPKPALWLVAIIQFVAPFALAERWWARLLLILLLWPGAVLALAKGLPSRRKRPHT